MGRVLQSGNGQTEHAVGGIRSRGSVFRLDHGLRKSINEESYKIRFTPRNPDSHWSKKNIEMVEELIENDRMQPAGLKAFEQMDEDNTQKASYECNL